MVPAAHIDAWRAHAPWPSEVDIEQDLVLSRLIVDIASNPLLGKELAFRGGTCLHKLQARVATRYSSDLDYTRTTTGPVKEILEAIRVVVAATGLVESSYRQGRDGVNIKFDAEPTRGIGRLRVKIELNTREVASCRERIAVPFKVENPWFTGEAEVLTFDIAEILGTKLRALYQRRKGRDLFDLWVGMTRLGAKASPIVEAFEHYLSLGGVTITRADFEANLEEKMRHRGFRSDLDTILLAPPVDYDVDAAAAFVRSELLALLR